MKKRLYFVGNTFKQNHTFREYIIRSVESTGGLDCIEYYKEADRSFYGELENRIEGKEEIYVICSAKSFTLIGKLLSTLTDDKLLLKNGMLIPSKCETFTTNSYLTHVKESSINIIQAQVSQTLPSIHREYKSSKHATIQLFEQTLHSAEKLLAALAKQFDVELYYSQVIAQWIEIKVVCKTYGSIEKFIEIAEHRHGGTLIVTSDLVQHIIDSLISTKQKITFAESCTGGLLASYFTLHAGVSSAYEGSLITYSNILKENWIAVENSTLVDSGAVSEAVVSEMCEGALSIANADYALAISGVAGPDGGSEEKPVGTVVIGLKSRHTERVETFHFQGDRNYVQHQSVLTALKALVLGDKKVFFTN